MSGSLFMLVACGVSFALGPASSACQTVNALGETEMARIPAGKFVMGADSDAEDNPAHEVHVDSFYIDKYEVTNAQYLEFCEETGRKLPEFWGMGAFHTGAEFPDHPVVGVSWQDAKAYAQWCGKRLPTEAEWEYAARGGLVAKDYPYEGEPDGTKMNFNGSEHGSTLPVGRFPSNGYGLYDMAGNVFEWVADRYGADYYQKSPSHNPQGPEKGRLRVIRGGGWHSGAYCNRVCYRLALPPQWVDFAVGFRCAKDMDPAKGQSK